MLAYSLIVSVLGIATFVSAQRRESRPYLYQRTCCDSLSSILPDKVSTSLSTAYYSTLNNYWSLQEGNINPSCVLRPESTEDVARAVTLLTSHNASSQRSCQFAVKSGGHTPFAGAANIEDGVTIDLGQLNQVTLSEDRRSVTIGPGNTWGRVYESLPRGLATGGGRVSNVGVGGLTLGGGVSFFSNRYGFVCDTVRSYEVVLASGRIVKASAENHRDLWMALKGGSNNFGIVTAFEQDVFEQGDFWGGFLFTPRSTFSEQFEAFERFTGRQDQDPYAALIMSFSFVPLMEEWVGASNIEYTKPEPFPPVFDDFTSLPNITSTMRIANLSSFTDEIAHDSNPPNMRNMFITGTYRNNADMVRAIFRTANETVQDIKHGNGLVFFSISFQPVSRELLRASARTAGNSLGLDADDGPLFNFLLTISWRDASNDAVINSKTRDMYDRIETAARGMGVDNPYIYLNYAASWQDPIAGYGQQSKSQLQRVSRKYDPRGVFQRLVPGGFKLFK